MGKEALVVPRELLFKDKYFQGFLDVEDHDFLTSVLQYHSYYPRGNALEANETLQQVIPYVWIVNPITKKVFLYKRVLNQNKKDGEYKETRYLNKYSGGVGGHIDRDTDERSFDPIQAAMMRELREEVSMGEYPEPFIVGFLNDDTDSLGKVHFGIVAIAETLGSVTCKDAEGLASGAFYSVAEVDALLANPENEFETWTPLSWPKIKTYIQQL